MAATTALTTRPITMIAKMISMRLVPRWSRRMAEDEFGVPGPEGPGTERTQLQVKTGATTPVASKTPVSVQSVPWVMVVAVTVTSDVSISFGWIAVAGGVAPT